jgi:predicted small lipoprotein YifL
MSKFIKFLKVNIILVVMSTFLCGCGLKGALYIPNEKDEKADNSTKLEYTVDSTTKGNTLEK